MPWKNMSSEEWQSLRWIEVSNAVASALLVVIMCGCAILLDMQARHLEALEEALRVRNAQGEVGMRLSAERNEQGEVSIRLLRQTVEKLEKLQPPLAVREVPAKAGSDRPTDPR